MFVNFSAIIRRTSQTHWGLCQEKFSFKTTLPYLTNTTQLQSLSYPIIKFSNFYWINLQKLGSLPHQCIHTKISDSSKSSLLEVSPIRTPVSNIHDPKKVFLNPRKDSPFSYAFIELDKKYTSFSSSTVITNDFNLLSPLISHFRNPGYTNPHKPGINPVFKILQASYSSSSEMNRLAAPFTYWYIGNSSPALDPSNRLFTIYENEANEFWCSLMDTHLGDSGSSKSKSFFFYYMLWFTLWTGISIMTLANFSPFIHENLLNYQTLFSSYFLAFWGSILCYLQSLRYGNRFSKYFGNTRYALATFFLLSSLGSLFYHSYNYHSVITIQLVAHLSGLISNYLLLEKQRLIPSWLSKYQNRCTLVMLFGYLCLYLKHSFILNELKLLNEPSSIYINS